MKTQSIRGVLKEEKIMALINWDENAPTLITVCRPSQEGIVYVAFEVFGKMLSPYEAFLGGPENSIPFDSLDENVLQILYCSALKALEQSSPKISTSLHAVN